MATGYDLEKDRKSPTDLCVGCGADTGIAKEEPVDGRSFYIEGCGQLCQECGIEQYQG
jgi:hypothetical protein